VPMSIGQDAGGGIVVEGVRRSFGKVQAVREASFTAPPGAVTALVGPNGSGKTTLMLMLASLLRPDAGGIRIAGFDPVARTAEVRARLGWMPDVLGSWTTLTVRQTLRFTGRLYRMDRVAAAERADALVDLVDLAELADQPTRVLSRGQKQRLSLARALVHDPAVLVLDEPASGLDPGARIALRDLLRRLAAEGRTVLVSSHVLAELEEMADAAVFLDAGVTVPADRVADSRATDRPWRIRAADPLLLERALVESGVPKESMTSDRSDVVVPVAGDEAAADLLARLVSQGVRISAFAPATGDLEHTFLDLARRPRP